MHVYNDANIFAQEKSQPMTTDWSKHISSNIAKVRAVSFSVR